jgi:hypothetical protein
MELSEFITNTLIQGRVSPSGRNPTIEIAESAAYKPMSDFALLYPTYHYIKVTKSQK